MKSRAKAPDCHSRELFSISAAKQVIPQHKAAHHKKESENYKETDKECFKKS